MQSFKNLVEYVKYCEQLCEEDTDYLFVYAIAKAAKLTKEEILEDLTKSLNIAYKWLREAVDNEYYLLAAKIIDGKNCQCKHYYRLAFDVLNIDIDNDIIAIDSELNNKFKNDNTGTNK